MKMKHVFSIVMIGLFGVALVGMAAYAEPTGEVKGRAKIYDDNGYTYEQIDKAKARLYKENGKRVDSDKTNSKGKFKFEDVEANKDYYIKCKADGYVNAKKPDKTSYKTSKFEVKDDKTVTKNCRMMAIEGEEDINYSERPKGTSAREWKAIMTGAVMPYL